MLWKFRREFLLIVLLLLSLTVFGRNSRGGGGAVAVPSGRGNSRRLEDLLEENRRLRQLLGLKQDRRFFSGTIAAEVISLKPLVCPGEIILDKGTVHGVLPGMTAVSVDGYLVGRIVEAQEQTSKVLTLYHPASRVSAVVKSTREVGILEASTIPFLSMKFLPLDSKLSVGDEVMTSGFSEFYPGQLPVGTISEIRNVGDAFFLEVLVKPYSCTSRLEGVVLGK